MSSSRHESILDLKPFLARLRRAPAAVDQAEVVLDFRDLIDDPPARPEPARRAAGLTLTSRVFLGLLGLSLAVGALITPLLLLIDPLLPYERLLIAGLVIAVSSLVSTTAAWWLVRGLVGRWLHQLHRDSAVLRQRAGSAAATTARQGASGGQATEVDRLVDAVSGLMEELKFQHDTRQLTERNDLIRTITALARALEARDPHTQNHSRSVARFSVRLGRLMGLAREDLYELHLAGLLHDIGKIAVPDGVLMKPGRLTEEEMLQVQAHVEWSWTILSPITTLGNVSLMVRHHHERFDGKGYPDRLAGFGIPLGARIMAVADMFVAMTEDRPYRRGLAVPVAVAELERVAGQQVDPEVVERFVECLIEDGVYQPVVPESNRAAAN